MAWTSVGFDGTINEAQWSQMAGLLGNDYVAAGNGDCLVTAVGGSRAVSVAAGSLYGDGIVSTNSGAETVAMTTPVNGQWYVIALRRTWATNTAALVAIAGATTTTTTPTAPPTSFPTLNTNKGVLTDQPIAWAWCNSANTTVVVYDIRLKAVKSMPPVVATSAERDAKFMTPTQGVQVWRDDLGAVETYFGLYNASTNPGGRETAGWYVDTRQTGLRPIQPSSAVIVSGSGSSNSLGQISFTNATAVSLNGIFTSQYRVYRVLVSLSLGTGAQLTYIRMRANGTDNQGTYVWGYNGMRTNGTSNAWSSTGNSLGGIMVLNTSATGPQTTSFDIYNPAVSGAATTWNNVGYWADSIGAYGSSGAGLHADGGVFDGLTLFPGGSTITGTIQVFGYND